ncbi:MAG: AMMECR1 domain-containing protein [Armatimonadota bacterium]
MKRHTGLVLKGLLIVSSAMMLSVTVTPAPPLSPLDGAERAPATVRRQACALARWAVEQKAAGKPLSPLPFRPQGVLARPAPCFVTISLDGRRRGCTGSFEPQTATLAQEIVRNAVRAWNQDPRTPRLRREDLRRAEFSVTIPGARRTVPDPSPYPPANYGLVVSGGGRSGVLLPGEAKTARWQAREARRQAGIREYVSVTFQIFRAVTFRERGQK